VELFEACGLLVGAGEGAELGVLIMSGEKGEAHGRAGTANLVVVAGIDGGWSRRVEVRALRA